MSTGLHAADNLVYLLDRTIVTDDDLADSGDDVLVRMANEWRREHSARFFLTIARNYQPIAGSEHNTFDSHDDSVLFPDKAALFAALRTLALGTGGARWIIVAAKDVETAVRAAIKPVSKLN
jgi:hypothetical protein